MCTMHAMLYLGRKTRSVACSVIQKRNRNITYSKRTPCAIYPYKRWLCLRKGGQGRNGRRKRTKNLLILQILKGVGQRSARISQGVAPSVAGCTTKTI